MDLSINRKKLVIDTFEFLHAARSEIQSTVSGHEARPLLRGTR